jgi:low affinity Fe/Cu permease
MIHLLGRMFTVLGVFTSRPAAFVVVLCYTGAWLILSPGTFGWHGGAAVTTLFMTLFIQRAEHRDTQAIHAKLDELLRVEGEARDELTSLDGKEPEAIERHRMQEQKRSGQ